MSKKDKFSKIYLQNSDFGFEYIYKRNAFEREQIVHLSDMLKIEKSKFNDNKVLVKCGSCNLHMDYIHGLSGFPFGKWVCPRCGVYIRENTANKYINRLLGLDSNNYKKIYKNVRNA